LRHLRKGLDIGLPLIGVMIILAAVLFLRELRIQLAVVMAGIVLIEAGVWKIAHQLLPNDRHYHALRHEIDAFIALSRDLHEAALAANVEDTPEHRRALDAIREAMHRAVDQLSDVAGRSAAELSPTLARSSLLSGTSWR
jgi:hypothetical protein